jgi:hypothetical protein
MPEYEDLLLLESAGLKPTLINGLNSHRVYRAGVSGLYKTGSWNHNSPDNFNGQIEIHSWDPHYVGRHYLKERTVYLVDNCLGWNVVPPTYLLRHGSLQVFVEGKTLDTIYRKSKFYSHPDTAKIAVLDFLLFQQDRAERNLLVKKTGGIVAIDNELSFQPTYLKAHNYVWELIDSKAVAWWYRNPTSILDKLIQDVLVNYDRIRSVVTDELISHNVIHFGQLIREMDSRFIHLESLGFVEAVTRWFKLQLSSVPFHRKFTRHP